MSHVLKKRMLVLFTSLLLALGVAAALPAAPAAAASSCAAQDQAYGKTQVRVAQAAKARKQAVRKVKRAKQAYAKQHTAPHKKKLVKAKKAKRRADRNFRLAQRRNAHARQVAARCHAANDSSSPATPPQVRQILDTLGTYGLSPTQVQALADQIADTLDGGLAPETLVAVLQPVVDALTDAGLPADQVSTALQQVLDTLSADDLPTDPDALTDLVVDSLQSSLAGTPLDQLNPILEQVQTGLDDLLGGLLGGRPIPVG